MFFCIQCPFKSHEFDLKVPDTRGMSHEFMEWMPSSIVGFLKHGVKASQSFDTQKCAKYWPCHLRGNIYFGGGLKTSKPSTKMPLVMWGITSVIWYVVVVVLACFLTKNLEMHKTEIWIFFLIFLLDPLWFWSHVFVSRKPTSWRIELAKMAFNAPWGSHFLIFGISTIFTFFLTLNPKP